MSKKVDLTAGKKIDEGKKEKAIELMKTLITNPDFPKIPKTEIKELSKKYGVNEKNVTAFVGRLEKFYSIVVRTKERKKSKLLDAELEKLVRETTTTMASAMATVQFKTTAKFSKIEVVRISNKKNKTASGKAFFTLGNGKECFIDWEYKNSKLFAGIALNEVIKE